MVCTAYYYQLAIYIILLIRFIISIIYQAEQNYLLFENYCFCRVQLAGTQKGFLSNTIISVYSQNPTPI